MAGPQNLFSNQMRIVSLIASATEIVCALGASKELVGRSHECDYPESVSSLPVCSSSKVNVRGSSREIDNQVKTIVEKALAVYDVKVDILKNLKPDVIVTQDQCEVCAVSLKDVEAAVCSWLDSKPNIVTLKPDSLKDFWEDIRRVAEAVGRKAKGEALISGSKKWMEGIVRKIPKAKQKLSIACIEWFDPLMAAGNWIPEMIEMLGARPLFGKPGQHSPYMTWAELKAKDPDTIITMPCGWDIKRSLEEINVLTKNPAWKDLKAVKENKVYITDGNQYFNRPGPRLVESFEIFAEILYPKVFDFGHKRRAWKYLTQSRQ